MSLRELALKSRFMSRNASGWFQGVQVWKEEGDYFWIHCGQSDNLELGIVGLCNVVALEYGTRPKLAEKALIAVLTSGFSKPAKLLRAVVTEMGSSYTINPLRFYHGVFETSPDASGSAQTCAVDLSRAHGSALRGTIQGAPGGFRRNDVLMADMPEHSELLTAVCAHVFSAAIKVATNGREAADGALRRMQRNQGRGIIPERSEMSQQFGEGVVCLVQQSYFLRYVVVFMYLSLNHVSGSSWTGMVAHLGRIIEDAGYPVYKLIRDHFVVPAAAPLALMIFTTDLLAFKMAAKQAVKLGALAPFVRFLGRPESSFFETGKFPFLVPFMRGYFEVIMPSNNLKLSAAYRNERLHRLGRRWAKRCLNPSGISQHETDQDRKKR